MKRYVMFAQHWLLQLIKRKVVIAIAVPETDYYLGGKHGLYESRRNSAGGNH